MYSANLTSYDFCVTISYLYETFEQKRPFVKKIEKRMKFQSFLGRKCGARGVSVDQSESFDVGDAAGNRLPEPGVMPNSSADNSADFNH